MLAPNAMSAAPSLSVVLTCHNSAAKLPATLASVWEQHGVQPEVVVVDRGSTDGTRDWLASHAGRVHSLATMEIEPHEALNQGLAAARGDWVLIFGERDRLVGDRVLSETLNWMKKTEAGAVAGEAAGDDGRLHKLRSPVNPLAGDFAPRAATFYRRSLFAENGPLDPAFGPLARYEFHLRLWKNRVRFKPIPLRIAACAPDAPFDWAAARQEIRARHLYFGAGRSLLWDVRSLLRSLRPKPRRNA